MCFIGVTVSWPAIMQKRRCDALRWRRGETTRWLFPEMPMTTEVRNARWLQFVAIHHLHIHSFVICAFLQSLLSFLIWGIRNAKHLLRRAV